MLINPNKKRVSDFPDSKALLKYIRDKLRRQEAKVQEKFREHRGCYGEDESAPFYRGALGVYRYILDEVLPV